MDEKRKMCLILLFISFCIIIAINGYFYLFVNQSVIYAQYILIGLCVYSVAMFETNDYFNKKMKKLEL